MNRRNDPLFDGRIADWLEDGPDRAPDQALQVVLAAVPLLRQRRRGLGLGPWRIDRMTTSFKFAIGAAAALVVALGGIYLLSPGSGPGVGVPAPSPTIATTPSPVPSASATPSPSPSVVTSLTTYESSRYGYRLGYPSDWQVQPAQVDWTTDGAPQIEIGEADRFDKTQVRYPFMDVAAKPLAAGTSLDAFIADWDAMPGQCERLGPRETTTIGGESARIVPATCAPFGPFFEVMVAHGDRLYLIALFAGDEATARPLLDRILATFEFVN